MLTYDLIDGVDINIEETEKRLGLIFFNGGSFRSKSLIKTVEEFSIPYVCNIWVPKIRMYIYYNPDSNRYFNLEKDYGASHSIYGYYIGGVTFGYPPNIAVVTHNNVAVTHRGLDVEGPAFFERVDPGIVFYLHLLQMKNLENLTVHSVKLNLIKSLYKYFN